MQYSIESHEIAGRAERAGAWRISPARSAQLALDIERSGAKCIVCTTEPFAGERNSVAALAWLARAYPAGYGDVVDAVARMVPKPRKSNPNWYDRLPDDLRYEVGRRFAMSRLVPDHLLSIAFLQAAKRREGKRFTPALQSFGVNALAVPVCELCSYGRGARLFERPVDMLRAWTEFRFGGSVAALRTDPELAALERLLRLAYETDIALEVDAQAPQRRTGNA